MRRRVGTCGPPACRRSRTSRAASRAAGLPLRSSPPQPHSQGAQAFRAPAGRPSWQRDGKPRGRAGTEGLGLPFTVVLRPRVPWHVLCATRRLTCEVYTYKHTSKRVPRASALSATGDVGTPEAVAPVIVIPPSNRSVVAGSSETTLECIANARCVPVPHAGSNNP
ncbi:hypothetical protein J1605_019527 [Eschrichtius robustus]|uniref:Uncharacterized protein n=1 Tax=Eschrichtius robustus TaxID=9764 RepID=A0AB34HIK8_ESCRO|nr:hypothetical protein J1605_019527 [Eschrichtius robustus]